MTTIVIVDDHLIVRQGLRALLAEQPDFLIVGECGDGLEALQLVEKIKPDVLIVDIMLPGLSGLEVTRRAAREFPRTRVIVLSMRTAEPYVAEALNSGASAYVLKAGGISDIVDAIHQAIAGQRYLSPDISKLALTEYVENLSTSVLDLYHTLTNREREVFQLVAEGLTNNQIALRLSISPRTVTTHRANLMQKLDIHSQVELAHYAVRRGNIGE